MYTYGFYGFSWFYFVAQFITLILNVCYPKIANSKHGIGNRGGDNGDTQNEGRNYQVHIDS
jgi:hypothetical protein